VRVIRSNSSPIRSSGAFRQVIEIGQRTPARNNGETANRRAPRASFLGTDPDVFSFKIFIEVVVAAVNLFDCVLRLIAARVAVGNLTKMQTQVRNSRQMRKYAYLQSSRTRTEPYYRCCRCVASEQSCGPTYTRLMGRWMRAISAASQLSGAPGYVSFTSLSERSKWRSHCSPAGCSKDRLHLVYRPVVEYIHSTIPPRLELVST